MMSKHLSFAGIAALLLFSAALPAAEPGPDNPASAEFQRNAKANRAKIETLAKEAGVKSDVHFFAVPPMSELMRLGDTYPTDGRYNGELRTFAAQGEFEPVSFQLFAMKDKKDVTFTISDLKSKKGAVLPAKQLDLRTVKIWYQNGNRWISYFQDVGLRLVPEMLLKDENMVKVDTEKVANYARIKDGKKEKFVWISAPQEMYPGFNPMQKGFEDAKTMQSVTLAKDQFKQFFVTIGVPADQAPGVYSGSITVKADGKNVAAIPVKLRVLPFKLPLPMTYKNLDMPVICGVMGGFNLSNCRDIYKDEKLAMEKFRELLTNIRDHNLLHPHVDQTEEVINIVKEMGFPTDGPWFGHGSIPWFARNFGGKLSFDNRMAAKAAADRSAEKYMKLLGHTKDVLFSYGDEQGAAFVVAHRVFHQYFQKYGFRMGCAGHHALYYKGAYSYDYHPMGGSPDAKSRIKRWNDVGNKYVGFYASQHTGSENPAFIRRQNGMLGYMSGLNMIYNYEFDTHHWNDLETVLYKPMVVAYRNYGGLVNTIQWEGFREAVDDLRYATLLQMEIKKGLESGDVLYRQEAEKAQMYFALMNPEKDDLDSVRAEMLTHILKLRKMAANKR